MAGQTISTIDAILKDFPGQASEKYTVSLPDLD